VCSPGNRVLRTGVPDLRENGVREAQAPEPEIAPRSRMKSGRVRIVRASLSLLVAAFSLLGCFETSDKSPRKLRVFYSSDLVGSLEPCG
jgi:hypothetical protein